LVCLVIALALLPGAARAGSLIGNSFDGTLYNVNPATGAATDPRSTGLINLAGIATRSDGALFGLTAVGGSPEANALFRIDPTSGTATLVGPTGLSEIIEGDLAFNHTTGTLYGIQEVNTTVTRGLFTIDPATGAATIVGDINAPNPNSDLSGMAFDSSGRLFVLDTAGSLLRVDPATAQVISSVNLSIPLGTTAGLTFDPTTGVAYVADGGTGGTNSLYTLDVTTGALTLVGSTGLSNGLAGLAFAELGVVVPEPSSLISALSAAMAVGLCFQLRGRRQVAHP
jgi:DNA-binding beta-propeller fold protein YncE